MNETSTENYIEGVISYNEAFKVHHKSSRTGFTFPSETIKP